MNLFRAALLLVGLVDKGATATALEGVAARALALSMVSFTAAAMLSRTCLRDRCVMSVFTSPIRGVVSTRQAEERERFEGAIKLAKELERTVDETKG